jgi:hypothetical protein
MRAARPRRCSFRSVCDPVGTPLTAIARTLGWPGEKAKKKYWPAFVDVYRTLLMAPPPELRRVFERLLEVEAA